MAVSQEFAAMLSQALDAADQCAKNETADNFDILGERLGELEELAKQSLASNVHFRPLVTKLQNGTPLTAEESGTLRSLIVGDADYYLKYDDDFDRSKGELTKILDQIRRLQSNGPDISTVMQIGVLCREAATRLAATEHYLEAKERVRRFEEATRGPLDSDAGRTLAGIIEDMTS